MIDSIQVPTNLGDLHGIFEYLSWHASKAGMSSDVLSYLEVLYLAAEKAREADKKDLSSPTPNALGGDSCIDRLQNLFLHDGTCQTSLDIQHHLVTVCSGSMVSELRKRLRGQDSTSWIECRYAGESDNRRKVYLYTYHI
jgi:hypothetical protein